MDDNPSRHTLSVVDVFDNILPLDLIYCDIVPLAARSFLYVNRSSSNAALPVLRRKYRVQWAAFHGHDQDVALLTKPGHNKLHALLSGDLQDEQLLLLGTGRHFNSKRDNPAWGNNNAIRMAAKNGHDKVVVLLLADRRVDPTVNDNEPIRLAARNGHAKVVALLLADYRVDPTVSDDEPIRVAAKNGHVDTVKLLLCHPKVNPDACNNAAFYSAQKNGHHEVATLLISVCGVERGEFRRRMIKDLAALLPPK